jgi:hypothetical protein
VFELLPRRFRESGKVWGGREKLKRKKKERREEKDTRRQT